MIARRSRITPRTRPEPDVFWEVARDTDATYAHVYSTMAAHLQAQPRRAAERQHRLRLVSMIPLSTDAREFAARLGIAHISTS